MVYIQLSYADLMLFNICDEFQNWDASILQQFPGLLAHYNKVAGLAAVKQFLQKRPPRHV